MKVGYRSRFAVLAGAAFAALGSADHLTAAFSSTRTVSFYHIHTQETLTVTYKKDGKFVPDALEKIDWIMRDWRRNEKTHMDPDTIDILWEMHAELGSKEPINIICGYRSRSTNEMLRRTVGGQASESQHITGKAVDVSFPDVPLKQMRYSALVRERGGVGYYPTSGIPFVHVDTGRVRHWPRLPRYELALLFPNGSSQHHPADGGSITPEDVKIAQSRHQDLADQIASFFTLRKAPKDAIMVADAGEVSRKPPEALAVAVVSKPKPAAPSHLSLVSAPAPPREPAPIRTAALQPPRLVAAPKLVERPSRLTPGPSEADRSQLATLVSLASQSDGPRLISGPRPVSRHSANTRADAAASVTGAGPRLEVAYDTLTSPRTSWTHLAALEPTVAAGSSPVLSDADRAGWGSGFAAAPAFDDEHPEELSYRPFPIAPLLTASASVDEPALSRITMPDVGKILQVLDSPSVVPPMSFRPGQQTAQLMWAQQFQGQPVELSAVEGQAGDEDVPTTLIPRSVKTTPE